MISAATHDSLARWLWPALLALALGMLVLPALPMRFHSDDLFLLVEDQSLPLTQSHDQMHRPLRNVVIKLAERAVGLDPQPYRAALFALYLAACLLLSRLLKQLHIRTPLAIAAGVLVFAFYPRNHVILFWFAAAQDTIVAVLALACCVTFLEFRRNGRPWLIGVSAILFALALGFKETAIVLAALVLLADLIAIPDYGRLRTRKFWSPYIAFAIPVALYLLYFFASSGLGSIAGKRTGGYYGAGGLKTAVLALTREIANLLLPFSAAFGLRQISRFQAAVLFLELFLAAVLAVRFRKSPQVLAALAWIVIAFLPTAVFAHLQNSDRYLLVPAIALAFLAADVTQTLLLWQPRFMRLALISGLVIYCAAGAYQLRQYREEWRLASNEFANLTTKLLAVRPAPAPYATVYVLGVTHSLDGFPVANNGLAGGLWAGGYDPSISIVSNFADASIGEATLLGAIRNCPAQAPPSPNRRVFVMNPGVPGVLEFSSACALELIQTDLLGRPEAWHAYTPDSAFSPAKSNLAGL